MFRTILVRGFKINVKKYYETYEQIMPVYDGSIEAILSGVSIAEPKCLDGHKIFVVVNDEDPCSLDDYSFYFSDDFLELNHGETLDESAVMDFMSNEGDSTLPYDYRYCSDYGIFPDVCYKSYWLDNVDN